MHERRNAVVAVVLALAAAWALGAWWLAPGALPGLVNKTLPVMIAAACSIYLFFALSSEPSGED